MAYATQRSHMAGDWALTDWTIDGPPADRGPGSEILGARDAAAPVAKGQTRKRPQIKGPLASDSRHGHSGPDLYPWLGVAGEGGEHPEGIAALRTWLLAGWCVAGGLAGAAAVVIGMVMHQTG